MLKWYVLHDENMIMYETIWDNMSFPCFPGHSRLGESSLILTIRSTIPCQPPLILTNTVWVICSPVWAQGYMPPGTGPLQEQEHYMYHVWISQACRMRRL